MSSDCIHALSQSRSYSQDISGPPPQFLDLVLVVGVVGSGDTVGAGRGLHTAVCAAACARAEGICGLLPGADSHANLIDFRV
jgi:hypothetical protein